MGAGYLVTGDSRAKKWVDKITEFYVGKNAENDVRKISGSYDVKEGAGNSGARPTTMSGAGVCAMGAGNQKIVDGAWDFLARHQMGYNLMDDNTCMYGLLIMSGTFNGSDQAGDPPPKITKPPAPSGVTATARTSSSILLSWNKVEEAFSYRVDRIDGSSATSLGTYNRHVTRAVVPFLEPQTSYQFRVTAVNTAGETSSHTVTGTTGAPADGEEVIAINVGGEAYEGADGIYYVADQYFSGGKGNPRGIEVDGTEDDFVYASERFGAFSYIIPVDQGDYVVELKFAEAFWDAAGKRLFSVEIEGREVEAAVDSAAAVPFRVGFIALYKDANRSWKRVSDTIGWDSARPEAALSQTLDIFYRPAELLPSLLLLLSK